MFPDEWNARDRYLDERQEKLDARERLLDAREHRLSALDAELAVRGRELANRERRIGEREIAAERREQTANEREVIADSREQHASARERLLDDRATAGDHSPSDPVRQIEDAFAREVARLDRSDAFLHRSRDAVQRAQARLDALRATNRDQRRAQDPQGQDLQGEDPPAS